MTGASTVEQAIARRIAAAGARLRSDRSVLRLADGLKAALAGAVPEGQTVIFTVTAPIRRRARTAAALAALARDRPHGGDVRETIEDNHVRMRRLTDVPPGAPKVVVLVHNPDGDADLILELAGSQLRQSHRQPG